MNAPLFGEATADAVWQAVCRHVDGLSVGSTVAALDDHGVLCSLTDGAGLHDLAARHGARPGYLMVALRLLADQGWLTLGGRGDDPVARLIGDGRTLGERAGRYRDAVQFLHTGHRFLTGDPGWSDPVTRRRWVDLVTPGARPDPNGERTDAQSVTDDHVAGHVVAPVLAALGRDRAPTGEPAAPDASTVGATGDPERDAVTREVLARLGWTDTTGRLTAAGRVAAAVAPQYWYPVTYLPLLARVPELIFGAGPPPSADADDAHLDRGLDLSFSAEVFRRTCRSAVLRAVDAAFASADRRPTAIVDIGCGDGSVLAAVWEHLRTPGLRMVGVEPSPVGRRRTRDALVAAGAETIVLDGRIGEPAAIVRALAEHGVAADDVLWLCKSVIHDRAFTAAGPGSASAAEPRNPVPSDFLGAPDVDGTLIPPHALATSLQDLLASWTPWMTGHGFLVVEAHQAPIEITRTNIGRGVNTVLDATHGYSCQYPLPPHVFAWSAGTAGWRSLLHEEPGAQRLGWVTLTVDLFVADPGPDRRVLRSTS